MVVTGTPLADILTGSIGNDFINGLDGDDVILGSPGADHIDGGPGRDQVMFRHAASAVTIDLSAGIGSSGEAAGDVYLSIEAVGGTEFDDHLTAHATGSTLRGFGGNDTLVGQAGDDRILGDAGADNMSGGLGYDSLNYATSRSAVTVDIGANTAFGGDATGDVISGFEALIGSHYADHLTGNAQNNRLFGQRGNDTLNGGDGNDTLVGGLGADLLNGGDGFDMAVYASETQNIAISSRGDLQSFGRAASGDRFISIEGVVGTQFGDHVLLGDEDNRIIGLGGNDFLDGGKGNDTLVGGTGADQMNGSTGIDTAVYRASDAAVQVDLSYSLHQTTGGHATGDVLSAVENLIGSVFDDRLTGNRLENRLRGLDGNDTLTGMEGADDLGGGAGEDVFAFVERAHHAFQKQSDSQAISRFSSNTADVIRDFTHGEDRLEFAATEFSGDVFNTNHISDLGLTGAGDSAFAMSSRTLFYVAYENAADVANGVVTVWEIARLSGVSALDGSDFSFV